jgi:hypothetical protein
MLCKYCIFRRETNPNASRRERGWCARAYPYRRLTGAPVEQWCPLAKWRRVSEETPPEGELVWAWYDAEAVLATYEAGVWYAEREGTYSAPSFWMPLSDWPLPAL